MTLALVQEPAAARVAADDDRARAGAGGRADGGGMTLALVREPAAARVAAG